MFKAARDGNLVELKHWVNCNNVCSRDEKGNTPLHLAAMSGSAECVAWLLWEKHAYARAMGEGGKTPLACACTEEVALLLLEAGGSDASEDALLLSVRRGREGVAKAIIEAGSPGLLQRSCGGITVAEGGIPEWALELRQRALRFRAENCLRACVAMLGRRRQSTALRVLPRDVLRLICKEMWSTRHAAIWRCLGDGRTVLSVRNQRE